jgi:hypothetical protein
MMSRCVRKFFNFDSKHNSWENDYQEQILKNSVVFPLIFFRAPTIPEWRKAPKRKEMEKFCFPKVKEIIDKIAPEKILVIGIGTYRKLKKIFDKIENEQVKVNRNNNKGKMVITAEMGTMKIFATIHFTGAIPKPNKEEWNSMKELFKEWLELS